MSNTPEESDERQNANKAPDVERMRMQVVKAEEAMPEERLYSHTVPKRLLWCAKCGRSVQMVQSQGIINRKTVMGQRVTDYDTSGVAAEAFCHGQRSALMIAMNDLADFIQANKPINVFDSDGLPCNTTKSEDPPPLYRGKNEEPGLPFERPGSVDRGIIDI